MSLKIVRNDITKMNTEAIVNTANDKPTVGTGCDYAVYTAAGFDELLSYRREKIGVVKEGDAFLTPGFNLPAKYIIHAVSPHFNDDEESENLLRSCYRKSLAIAKENNIKSISFPLISTGSFGYPKEAGLRIALDEINAFLLDNEMDVTIVVFDEESTKLSQKISNRLEKYIGRNYVSEKTDFEYKLGADVAAARPFLRDNEPRRNVSSSSFAHKLPGAVSDRGMISSKKKKTSSKRKDGSEDEWFLDERSNYSDIISPLGKAYEEDNLLDEEPYEDYAAEEMIGSKGPGSAKFEDDGYGPDYHKKLKIRLEHLSDTFSEYLMFLIEEKGMKAPEVYNGACIDKKLFSKIKNDRNYHPEKRTALCLCIGAKLNLDQSKDLLARAGYAFSPADLTDIIFKFFIENEIYDIVEVDIQLEEYGCPCIIV